MSDSRHASSDTGDPIFRALLEAAPDAMIIADGGGRMAMVNGQAERLFGYARGELVGQPIELLIPSRYQQSHIRHREVYLTSARTRPMGAALDLYARRKDGTEFPVDISLNPIHTEAGVLVVGAIRDITDRRRAEAERATLVEEREAHAEANRIKDEFIATLSHELRTPLNAILGWATLLDRGLLTPEKSKRAVTTIIRNALAQKQLVEDLLDVSRIIAGKLTLRPKAIDLAGVVDEAVEVVRPSAAARQLSLETHFDSRPLLLLGDPDRLQQVLWNLLSNAVKFSNEHGRVEVRAWAGDDTVHLLVRDTGQGIEPRFLPHVFDRFRQADSTYTRQHGGLGLGLALVRSIVELHGGTVTVSSSGRGMGATFQLTLPSKIAREPFDLAADSGGAAAAHIDRVRILVVDDWPDERELLSTILVEHGADIRTAGSADEAIDVLREWNPQVLITDIAMPGGDGYALLRRVRAIPGLEDLPAIAVTAHARLEDRERAEAAGFAAYLAKPVEHLRLLRLVAGLAGTGDRRK